MQADDLLPILALAAVPCSLSGCAGTGAITPHDRPTPVPAKLAPLPAGLCSFDPYLSEPCADVPPARFAILLHDASGRTPTDSAVEALLTRAHSLPLAAGYPFVVTLDDMPARARERRGTVVVAGLFAERDRAQAYADRIALPYELIELADAAAPAAACADTHYDDCMARRSSAIEISTTTPAWAAADLARVEQELDEALATSWVSLPIQHERRQAALRKLAPRCVVEPGRVFSADQHVIYKFRRTYVPIRCSTGEQAWVPITATRLHSVVLPHGSTADIHQVILVECDTPTIETRPFGAASLAASPPTLTASSDGC